MKEDNDDAIKLPFASRLDSTCCHFRYQSIDSVHTQREAFLYDDEKLSNHRKLDWLFNSPYK